MHDESFLPATTMPAFYYRGTHGQTLSGDGQGQGLTIGVGGGVVKGLLQLGALALGTGVAYMGVARMTGPHGGGKGQIFAGSLLTLAGVAIGYFGGIRPLAQG